jgi:hypothetical protein
MAGPAERGWGSVRRPIRPLVLAGLAGALVAYAFMGGLSGHSGSTLPAHNAAIGLVNSIRVGDPGACEMLTASGQRDLARVLGASQAGITEMQRRGLAACATVLANASPSTRMRAMAPFLGHDSQASGSAGTRDDDALEWNQRNSGTYAVIRLHRDIVHGWVGTSIRTHSSCLPCS